MKLFGSIVFAILSVMANGQNGPNRGGNPNGTPCIGSSGSSGVCGSNAGGDCPNICNALGISEGTCNGVGNDPECANNCFTCTPFSSGHNARTRVRSRKF